MRRREFITLLGGTAVALPLPMRAQSSSMPLIGIFNLRSRNTRPTSPNFSRDWANAALWKEKMSRWEYRWADGQYDRLPAMAAELVARKVDLIAAFGPPPAHAANNASAGGTAHQFELIINLKTAKTMEITVPSKLMFTADEGIE